MFYSVVGRLKNLPFLTGLLISFVGTLPVGVLNLTALQYFLVQGWSGLLLFAGGVITIEAIVAILSWWILRRYVLSTRIKKGLQAIGVIYLLVLLCLFFLPQSTSTISPLRITETPFILGLTYSALNPLQWGFWFGWNSILLTNTSRSWTTFSLTNYFVGIPLGTLLGMVAFVHSGILLTQQVSLQIPFALKLICALLIGVAVVKKLLHIYSHRKIKLEG